MLTYDLDHTACEPLYMQLYHGIRADIERGALREGDRLPSKRALAQHLCISIMTVEGAFRQLVAEGYLHAEPRRGFFVRAGGFDVRPARATQPISAPATQASAGDEAKEPQPLLADLTGATAPTGIFPYAAWARVMRTALSAESERTLLDAAGPQGSLRLREAIAEHLWRTRGVEAPAERIVIGSGAQHLYGLVVQLLGRGRAFAIEDPGYPRLHRIYRSHGVRVAPIRIDEEGPDLNALEESGAAVMHCMPSHQFPLGTTTTIGRRTDLLAWAERMSAEQERRYLIEDDFDCEFRMHGRPIPTLLSLDREGCVIYANTFTKTLGAAFRIGYLVLPEHLAHAFREQLGFYACTVGALEQLTLARFMESGEYERHVNRQRTHFRKVQDALVEALARAPGASLMRLRNVGAGLHFVLEAQPSGAGNERASTRPLDLDAFEGSVVRAAREHGIALAPLGSFLFDGKGADRAPAFVISYASVPLEACSAVASVLSRAIMQAEG